MSEKFLTIECFPGRYLSRYDSNKRVKKKGGGKSAWIPHPGNVGTEEANHLRKSKRRE